MLPGPVATFYDGYDLIPLRRAAPGRVPAVALAIVVGAAALVVLAAADVSAWQARPAAVHVTSVSWYVNGTLLTTLPGFSIRAGATTVFPVVCNLFCLEWAGASVGAPFQLVAFSEQVSALGIQYTNVTVQVPSFGYTGPLAITLDPA